MGVYKIAITGGPCGGKTTIQNAVRQHFGNQIITAPEVASVLIDNLFPKPGKDVNFSDTWIKSFQSAVVPTQLSIENTHHEMATQHMTRLVIFDRGLLDGAAYLEKGLDYFLEMFNLNLDEVHNRYDCVIHLESLAIYDPKKYEELKSTNPARYENADEAIYRDQTLKEVWRAHPNWICVEASNTLEEKTRKVIQLLSSYLNEEIERKYLLPSLPDIPETKNPGVEIIQGYFPISSEVRLRKMGDECSIAIKGPGTHTRPECERQITHDAFDEAWPDTKNRVFKTRYFIKAGDNTLEIDDFHDDLAGRVTLECEFNTMEEFEAFKLPDWANDAIEITDSLKDKNRYLLDK